MQIRILAASAALALAASPALAQVGGGGGAIGGTGAAPGAATATGAAPGSPHMSRNAGVATGTEAGGVATPSAGVPRSTPTFNANGTTTNEPGTIGGTGTDATGATTTPGGG